MPREKYKIHELAKDFGMNSKAIIEILAKLDDASKKFDINFVLSVSVDADSAPEYIKKYTK